MELPTGDLRPDLAELIRERMTQQPLDLHETVRGLLVEVQDLDSFLNAENTESLQALREGISEYRSNQTAVGGADQFNSLLDNDNAPEQN